MKTVYLHGSSNGIQWVEDQSSNTLSSSASQWGDQVRFAQHPNSERDVFVSDSGQEVAFSLQGSSSDTLRSRTIELSPRNNQDVFLREDDGAGSGSGQSGGGGQGGRRWHSGYVQRG